MTSVEYETMLFIGSRILLEGSQNPWLVEGTSTCPTAAGGIVFVRLTYKQHL